MKYLLIAFAAIVLSGCSKNDSSSTQVNVSVTNMKYTVGGIKYWGFVFTADQNVNINGYIKFDWTYLDAVDNKEKSQFGSFKVNMQKGVPYTYQSQIPTTDNETYITIKPYAETQETGYFINFK